MASTEARGGGHWTERVASAVNTHLARFFDEKLAQADQLSPRAKELVTAVSELTMRGGKRLRPLALYAGHVAVLEGAQDAAQPSQIVDAAAALELLQSYFLIQDDWMDGDEERRGGPAVHATLSRAHGDAHLGASLAILAGDCAAGFAFELLHRAPFPAARLREGFAAFGTMHFEVVCGQQLDLLEHPEVALTHHLKTGSYSVRGPLRLGALLGDASDAQLQALERFGEPLGVAFQLRDDLLGTFGDPNVTGKPIGHDLREGKNTVLVAEARKILSGSEWRALDDVLGDAEASEAQLTHVAQLLQKSGVRERVEAQLRVLTERSAKVLAEGPFTDEGKQLLGEILTRLTRREK